jgi:putative ABC transport system ATP-binding protein
VNNLSFSLPQGEFWSLMGPSGSGKSSVLHLIAGLTRPTSGQIVVEDQEIGLLDDNGLADLRRRRVGYVLQSFNLITFLSASANVAAPLVIDRVSQSEITERVERALALVKMDHRAAHLPSELSGGEQQRVAIARALVINPSIVLADEPTGNLDRTAGRAVMDLIADINEETGITVLIVTHDPIFGAMARLVLRLVDGAVDQEIPLGD